MLVAVGPFEGQIRRTSGSYRRKHFDPHQSMGRELDLTSRKAERGFPEIVYCDKKRRSELVSDLTTLNITSTLAPFSGGLRLATDVDGPAGESGCQSDILAAFTNCK